MQCSNAICMLFFMNCENEKFSQFYHHAPKTRINPKAASTPLMLRAFTDLAELVCKLAFAVFVEVPPAVCACSAGTTVRLVTVVTPPFGKVEVYSICCVTEREAAAVI
jgi:hypothetical protein